MICRIFAVKVVFKSSGVSATMALSQSSSAAQAAASAASLVPILVSSWNLSRLSPVIPPP